MRIRRTEAESAQRNLIKIIDVKISKDRAALTTAQRCHVKGLSVNADRGPQWKVESTKGSCPFNKGQPKIQPP
jgi:hypothetical protein